jgi:flagellar hook protein FlgE
MTVFDVALGGLHQAEAKLETAASRLARLPVSLESANPEDVVDLSAEMVALLEARNDFQINTRVIHTADELARHLLDLLR